MTAKSMRLVPEDWLHPMPLQELFDRSQPLEIDIGFGKGRFLLTRSRRRPDHNVLGIERMLRRLRKVDRKAVRAGLTNVRVMRVEAYYALRYLIPAKSVSACYIFFPDPWPKKRHHRHRLMGPEALDALNRILLPGGRVHLATDHYPYFEEVKSRVLDDTRFVEITPYQRDLEETTEFEHMFQRQRPTAAFSFRTILADTD